LLPRWKLFDEVCFSFQVAIKGRENNRPLFVFQNIPDLVARLPPPAFI